MPKLSICACVLLALCACETRTATNTEAPAPTKKRFPDDWVGTWSGEMVYHNKGRQQLVPLSLTISPGDAKTGSWGWQLTYGGQPPRRYLLKVRDAGAGRYEIDEQNGIVLPAQLIDDTLLSRFAVGRQLLLTRQRFLADRIEHEIVSGPRAGKPAGQRVEGYVVPVLQRAVLRQQPL